MYGKATCLDCNGDGEVSNPFASTPDEPVMEDCPHCDGTGECDCNDCSSAASEAAWERRCEDFYGGSSPMTLDEQHRAAWLQKQELRR